MMSCRSFKKRLKDIVALEDDHPWKTFLIMMGGQLWHLWARAGCGIKGKCKRRRYEKKLDYYWNHCIAKET